MRFAFTDDQLALRDAVRDFLEKECPPQGGARRVDERHGSVGSRGRSSARWACSACSSPRTRAGSAATSSTSCSCSRRRAGLPCPSPSSSTPRSRCRRSTMRGAAAAGEVTVTVAGLPGHRAVRRHRRPRARSTATVSSTPDALRSSGVRTRSTARGASSHTASRAHVSTPTDAMRSTAARSAPPPSSSAWRSTCST